MIIEVGNIACRVIIGGADNLIGVKEIEKELREYLRVRAENYFRSPAYKSKRWDGYRHFMTKDMRFATGFLPLVIPFLEDLGVKIKISDLRGDIPKFRDDFRDTLGDKTLRPIQLPLVQKVDNYIKYGEDQLLYFPRGIIDAATNAGKTLVMGLTHDNLEDASSIIVVHREEIYKQLVKAYSPFFDVGEISQKRYRITDLTIAMVGTLGSKLKGSLNVKKDMMGFNTLFVDEAHRAGGESYSKVLKEIPAGVRLLVSGTALENKSKVKNMLITAMSGRKLATVTNKEMIAAGHSLRPVIHMKMNDVWDTSCNSYDAEVEQCIHKSEKRMQDTIEWIKERTDKIHTVAFDELVHGLFYSRRLKEAFPHLVVELVHGKDEYRSEKLESFKKKEIDVLVCSAILQEGFDTEVINTMVYGIAGESSIRLKQFIGRGVRDDGESETFELLDWWDVGNYVRKHSYSRLKIYEREGFEIKYHYPATKTGRPKTLLN